jgi:hypothetical protein
MSQMTISIHLPVGIIPTVQNVDNVFYKRLHSNVHNHCKLLISELSVTTIPGDLRKYLKLT